MLRFGLSGLRSVVIHHSQKRHGTSIPVILINDLAQKGSAGDEIIVKRGYARNFLIPRKVAVYATESNRLKFQRQSPTAESSSSSSATSAAARISALQSLGTLHFTKPAAVSGSLYAAITEKELKEALAAQGIEAQHVDLAQPIKAVGETAIRVDNVEIKVVVASS
eukprot:gene3568-3907_t